MRGIFHLARLVEVVFFFITIDSASALNLVSATSRRLHGSVEFDLPLPLTGAGSEPRQTGITLAPAFDTFPDATRWPGEAGTLKVSGRTIDIHRTSMSKGHVKRHAEKPRHKRVEKTPEIGRKLNRLDELARQN